MPHLITDVQTTPAPVSDCDMLPTMQAALATREVLPAEHLVEAGYVTADHLVASQTEHDITLLGPVNPDASWQAKAQQGFDVASFLVDWDTQTVVLSPWAAQCAVAAHGTTDTRIPSSICALRGQIAKSVRTRPMYPVGSRNRGC